jgi:hypothetical protein
MIRPAVILLLLLGLALLARLDRDGLLARSDLAAQALGLEVRIEVKLQRAGALPKACWPDGAAPHAGVVARETSCE